MAELPLKISTTLIQSGDLLIVPTKDAVIIERLPDGDTVISIECLNPDNLEELQGLAIDIHRTLL